MKNLSQRGMASWLVVILIAAVTVGVIFWLLVSMGYINWPTTPVNLPTLPATQGSVLNQAEKDLSGTDLDQVDTQLNQASSVVTSY